ncbi:MAG TPA: hypothetical protein PKX92_08680 [Edaphocola sp.]|nr:hypothetical protein [Edaphocola sp.]
MKLLKIVSLGLLATGLSFSSFAQNKHENWGRNNIKFYPLSTFTYGGVGFGVAYERIMDQKGLVGVQLPLHLGLSTDFSNDYDATIMFNPGVKIYPWGQRKVTYALGTSIFFNSGNFTRSNWDYQTGLVTYSKSNRFSTGLLINQYLQFNITENINLGFEFGAGPSYINREKDKFTGQVFSDGIDGMVNFGFHFGYRF